MQIFSDTSGITRREARPWLTQYLWDAIQYLQSQKQPFDAEILCKTTARRHPDFNESMARSELACAVRDGLIKINRNSGSKGYKNSVEKDFYHLPDSQKVFLSPIIKKFYNYISIILKN